MADWLAPFHLPHMPTAEFNELKRKYIEKHGYTLTIPGLEDVFHFKAEKPLTQLEQYHWKHKNRKHFTPDRYEEIRYMKQRRQEKFLSMLGSPSPNIFNSRSAIITSLDDCQDALSTLSAIGTLAYMGSSATMKKIIGGPLGWMMTAENALNYVTRKLSPERRLQDTKKATEKTTKKGQTARQTKIDKTARMLKAGKWQGKMIEGLQTTDSIFGTGISLGSLMNLPIDLVSGFARTIALQKTDVKFPTIDIPHWQRVARKAARNWLAFEGAPEKYFKEEHHSPVVRTEHVVGISSVLSDTDIEQAHVALFLATQTMHSMVDIYDPSDINVPHEDLELRAPVPTNILTLEVIKEAGDDPEEGSAWPATGEKWSNARDLAEESSKNVTANFNSYCERNAHSEIGRCIAEYSVDASLYNCESFAGTGTIQIEGVPTYRAINSLQNLNFCVEQELSRGSKLMFADYLRACDKRNYTPSTKEILEHAERYCGISFVQMVD